METELWRPVRGFEGYYEVSDQGRVKRVAGGAGARLGQALKPGTTVHGYRFVILSVCGTVYPRLVHREVLRAFSRPMRADQTDTRHLDGDKSNNQLRNLQWGSKKENQADRFTHGTDSSGEKCYNAKLTESQIREILKLWETRTLSQPELAKQFGVTRGAIGSIVYRKSWKRLTP